MPPDVRQLLRRQYRQRRNALSAAQQQDAALLLSEQVAQQPEFERAQRVALYLANDGEIATTALIERCWQSGKQVLLPVLHPFSAGHLVFVDYAPHSEMTHNRFGIAEPRLTCQSIQPLSDIDLVLTPLVAFDRAGNRLGMGGGFYDRTLAPVQRDDLRTQVFGVGHDCQQADTLPFQAWDIPLQRIITPHQVISPD